MITYLCFLVRLRNDYLLSCKAETTAPCEAQGSRAP